MLKTLTLLLVLALAFAGAAPAAFVGSHPTIPLDDKVDAHSQIVPRLAAGDFVSDAGVADLLSQLGWVAPFSRNDEVYARTHASSSGRSILSHLVSYLHARRLIGVAAPEAPAADHYPGKPSFYDAVGRLEEFGLTTRTSGTAEQRFFVERYWQNKLTPDNDEAWLARERGLYRLPAAFEANPAARSYFIALEDAIARYGLSGSEQDRQAALVAYFAFEELVLPAPGSAVAPAASGPGLLVVNPRRVFYRGRKIENALATGRASDAAKLCTGVAWQLGLVSDYEQYALQTYPLSERNWQYALGLPVADSSGTGFHINGR